MDSRYVIVQELAGEGGYGKIDKVYDNALERHVAVKTLDPLFRGQISDEDKERFRREAKILARLQHPNIPAIYDISLDGGEFKILFQWIDGRNLRTVICDDGPVSLHDARRYFHYICMALDHIHSNGVIHRDIKPANIIVTSNKESCYVVDLGIALNQDDIVRISGGRTIGTPGYMSPEQQRGEELSPVSDIFTLGIVLYECLCGNRPVEGSYSPLNEQNPTIPPSVDELVKRCLSPEKSSRPQTAMAVYRSLIDALRPSASITELLTEGRLFDIQVALVDMDVSKFLVMPYGQRLLLVDRLKDLVNVDKEPMRNAVASYVAALLRHSSGYKGENYKYIVNTALKYGFDVQYSEKWTGNLKIREVFCDVFKYAESEKHNITTSLVDAYFSEVQDFDDKAKWYYHDLRDIIQYAMANSVCSEDDAELLSKWLVKVNELSHRVLRDEEPAQSCV